MSADGVVRFEFNLWTVSSVFITVNLYRQQFLRNVCFDMRIYVQLVGLML
jgi:hypothetical protein